MAEDKSSKTAEPEDVVAKEAQDLSEEHGFDCARIEKILRATARDENGNHLPANASSITINKSFSFYLPSLREALSFQHSPPILDRFEGEDLANVRVSSSQLVDESSTGVMAKQPRSDRPMPEAIQVLKWRHHDSTVRNMK